jgi:hypothetical protein
MLTAAVNPNDFMVILIGFSCVESASTMTVVESDALQTRRPRKMATLSPIHAQRFCHFGSSTNARANGQ